MTYLKRFSATLIVIGICYTFGPAVVTAQNPGGAARRPAVIQYDGDLAALLSKLPEVYGVPIGFEVDPLQPRSTVAVYLKDPSLADVLNAMMRSEQRYQWRENAGVVEVFPREGSSPLLDIVIDEFRVTELEGTAAIRKLLDSPSLRSGLKGVHLGYRVPIRSSSVAKRPKLSLNLQNVTLREALNKIAQEDGTRFWMFTKDRDGIFSIGI